MSNKRRFSHSARTMFHQCNRKYFHIAVARDVKDEFKGPAAQSGTDYHTDLEVALVRERALPTRSKDAQWTLDFVKALTGLKIPERFLSVDYELAPHPGRGPGVFNTAKLDVLVLRAADAIVVDYKTGKHSSDMQQLQDSAAMVFAHFPTVVQVTGHLLFTHTPGLKETAVYRRENVMDYVASWYDTADDVTDCERTGVWPANPSALCGWCPVTGCDKHPGSRV